jgi:hypothetical protein
VVKKGRAAAVRFEYILFFFSTEYIAISDAGGGGLVAELRWANLAAHCDIFGMNAQSSSAGECDRE